MMKRAVGCRFEHRGRRVVGSILFLTACFDRCWHAYHGFNGGLDHATQGFWPGGWVVPGRTSGVGYHDTGC